MKHDISTFWQICILTLKSDPHTCLPTCKEIYRFLSFLEKEARYLRQEVREKAQDIKDMLGGKVVSAAQEVQRLGQEVRDEAQDIKDELGGKVESAVQYFVQCLGQELGRPDSSAGGQLVIFSVYLLLVKYFPSNIGTCKTYQGNLYGAHCAHILTETASYIFEAEKCQLSIVT